MARKQRGGDMGFTDWFFVLGLFVTVLAIVLGVLWGAGVLTPVSGVSGCTDTAVDCTKKGGCATNNCAGCATCAADQKYIVEIQTLNVYSVELSADNTSINVYYNIHNLPTVPGFTLVGWLHVTTSDTKPIGAQPLSIPVSPSQPNSNYVITPVIPSGDITKITGATVELTLYDNNKNIVPNTHSTTVAVKHS